MSSATPVPEIRTQRLVLIEITRAALEAELDPKHEDGLGTELELRHKHRKLGEVLQMEISADWPPEPWEPHVLKYFLAQMVEFPQFPGWNRYVVLLRDGGRVGILIGGCGTTAPVIDQEEVEIGYSIVPSFEGMGYTTEAVGALVEWLFKRQHIRSIYAQTFPENRPSIRVLEKSGFHLAGPGKDEGAVLYRRGR